MNNFYTRVIYFISNNDFDNDNVDDDNDDDEIWVEVCVHPSFLSFFSNFFMGSVLSTAL